LDHINGKRHQRKLGMSMRVERSTLGQIKNRLAMHKRKHESGHVDVADRFVVGGGVTDYHIIHS
jgi:hypothetical protein